MDSKSLNLQDLQRNNAELEKTFATMDTSQVFSERKGSFINEFALFMVHFNSIPNFIHEININCKKAGAWFLDTYKDSIKDTYYSKLYFNKSNNAEYDDVFYILYEDLIVDFDTSRSIVRFLFRNTDITRVEAIISGISRFKEKKVKRKYEILLLVNFMDGIGTKSLTISKAKLNIEDNYNDDFKDIHAIILKRLSTKNDKGLVLLHGKPGTGKTSYIRYLIGSLRKNVIFLPPDMTRVITSPDLVSIAIDNPNSIFVIEDAENIVVDREKDGSSPVSALLNISDGLLSDCLNIQVICSFNIDISKVDNALIRKGRLIAKYEFTELEASKANILSRKLGFNTNFNCPMTLAAIYNQEDREFNHARTAKQIGFKPTHSYNN